MGKIIAIDYGSKRMGIAVSDETKTIAFPRDFIEAKDFDGLLDLITREEPEEIIVGYPRALSGKQTAATDRVDEFVRRLGQRVDIPVWKIDERLTTREVLRELQDMGQKYGKQKGNIDSFVAAKMLERYLRKRHE